MSAKAMNFGILGKKIGMTKIFAEDGSVVPVTVVQAGPCTVLQKKTQQTDKYDAIQLGFDEIAKVKNVAKPKIEHCKKANAKPLRFIKEIRLPSKDLDNYQIGQQIKATIFKSGDLVDVTGTSIGKGFAGVIKRHGMHGFPMTRGTHEYRRHIGSVGCRFPQHVLRGHRMPGHMGDARVTIQNLKVVAVREPDDVLLLEGAVPGYADNYLIIRKALKREPKAPVAKQAVKAKAEKAAKAAPKPAAKKK